MVMLTVIIFVCLPSNQTASVDFTPLPHGLPTLALLATSVRGIQGVLMLNHSDIKVGDTVLVKRRFNTQKSSYTLYSYSNDYHKG